MANFTGALRLEQTPRVQNSTYTQLLNTPVLRLRRLRGRDEMVLTIEDDASTVKFVFPNEEAFQDFRDQIMKHRR